MSVLLPNMETRAIWHDLDILATSHSLARAVNGSYKNVHFACPRPSWARISFWRYNVSQPINLLAQEINRLADGSCPRCDLSPLWPSEVSPQSEHPHARVSRLGLAKLTGRDYAQARPDQPHRGRNRYQARSSGGQLLDCSTFRGRNLSSAGLSRRRPYRR